MEVRAVMENEVACASIVGNRTRASELSNWTDRRSPEWKRVPPAAGEAETKMVNNILPHSWCTGCRRWTWGRKLHTTATHIRLEGSGQALAPASSTAAPAAPAPAAVVAPVSVGMAAATEDVYQGGGLQLLGSLFMGQMTETMTRPSLNDTDASPYISSPTFCSDDLFFTSGTRADNNDEGICDWISLQGTRN
jgi:hypothetical protein